MSYANFPAREEAIFDAKMPKTIVVVKTISKVHKLNFTGYGKEEVM